MFLDTTNPLPKPEIWGGIECTINRIDNTWRDQLKYSQHYERPEDIEHFASLGIKALRCPVLWELHQPVKTGSIDWTWITRQLNTIRSNNIIPIVGLMHHGSGPGYVDLLKDDYPQLLAAYAKQVAEQFPWVEYYTPVNEPLTTARFSGLYGLWYPHHKNDHSFAKMLLLQLKAIVLSMQSIRSINPLAKLVQTEDLAKIHSTKILNYQADFENERRWISYDILCGRVNSRHLLWNYFTGLGIEEKLLNFFIENPCTPDIIGCNYYITSERYLDHNIECYPDEPVGGNGIHRYVDVSAVHHTERAGLYTLLKEVWNRYGLQIALTEIHLNCTREEQMRWMKEAWDTGCLLIKEGIPVRAITAWSLIGAFDWNSLLTRNEQWYESGIFKITNNQLRPTAAAKLIKSLAECGDYNHALLKQKGWWHTKTDNKPVEKKHTPPLLIIGSKGTLGNALIKFCNRRSICFQPVYRNDFDITDKREIERMVDQYKPWGIINASGYVRVDEAEDHEDECFRVNVIVPSLLAETCDTHGIQFMTFSSDLVFDGKKGSPYFESDNVGPLNIYGESKAMAEKTVLQKNPLALIVRTSAFFGPWDTSNFAYQIIHSLKENKMCPVVQDIIISPTYVPDLVNTALDIFIDEEKGIWHLSNDTLLTWFEFATLIAERAGYKKASIHPCYLKNMEWNARRPMYSALQSEKGLKLPSVENAIGRFFDEKIQ